MNKKTKVLATSIATIAMTTSLAVGGTYALFTSEDKVNVAITSGKVEVLANVVESSFETSTSLSAFTGTNAFELGGTVAYDEATGSVKLENMVPGDKFTFDIDLVNNSNVGIQYRVVMSMDGALAGALQANATIDNTGYAFSAMGATKWIAVNPGDTTKSINDTTKTDETANDDYQEKAASLTVKVEAVQGNASVLDGSGTAEDPYQVFSKESFALLGELYGDEYIYAEIDEEQAANGVIDGTGWSEIKFHGSFNGNGAKIENLSASLFNTVGYQNKVETITIEDLDVTMNSTTGRALVHNLFNGGETIFKDVNVHGYIEGQYNLGSFYRYGTANYDDLGCDYTVSFINSKSDATLVDVSGNIPGGMFGHPFCGAGNMAYVNVDENSGFEGALYSTNGKGGLYTPFASLIQLNGKALTEAENTCANTGKISVVKADKNADGTYSIAKQANVTSMVVTVTAQLTAYDANGQQIANASGITMALGNQTLTNLSDNVQVFDAVSAVELVTGTGEYKYELVNGVLKVWCGTANYQSGAVRLQVAQYDAQGSVVSVGTVDLAVITKA